LFFIPLYIIEGCKRLKGIVLKRGEMVLMERMADKDREFIDILEKYEKLAFSVCYKITGNYFDAEDMTQETFLSIYKSLNSFDGNNPGGFVTRIAVNKCLDFLKRADRRTVPAEENILLENASSVPPPEEGVLQEETKRELIKACSTLKPPYNEVATDYYCNGMTAAQIAGITGKKLKTVQTQIRRAKELLRKKIRKEDII